MKTVMMILIGMMFVSQVQASEAKFGGKITQMKIACKLPKSKLTFDTNLLELEVDLKAKKVKSSEILRETTFRINSVHDVSGNEMSGITTETSMQRLPSGHISNDSKMYTAIISATGSEEDVGKHILNLVIHNSSVLNDAGFNEALEAEVSLTSLADDDSIWSVTKSSKCKVQIIK